MKKPSEMNYRMPAEWEPHTGTWMTWPRSDGISFPGKYETVLPALGQMIHHLALGEDIYINVWGESMEKEVIKLLQSQGVAMQRVFFHHFRAYEPWCRDHGPVFITREMDGHREKAIVNWGYNAWGGKYPPFDLDNLIPLRVAELRGVAVFDPNMVLEGGSIEVNGCGTLLTTEACLLNANRNPEFSQASMESRLMDFLGISKIIWLGEGVKGDDTDGHIDTLARFTDASTIVIGVESDSQDPNYAPLQENLERLRGVSDQDGRPIEIIEVPMPDKVECQGQRLPATYMNFYIGNQSVLVPTYRCDADAQALDILQERFPDRKVVGIDSTELIWGLGSFHCLTQQEPQ